MTNYEKAVARSDEIDREIIKTVESDRNFRVEAGAGAGKTYSLEKVIEWLDREKKKQFKKYGQNVACITYTNAAVDVIAKRLLPDSFIRPSTIHTFAWNLIKQFQSSLISTLVKLQLLPKKQDGADKFIDPSVIKSVTYTLGVRYFEDGTLYLYHDDVIKLFADLLNNAKFRSILTKKFPIILIDEYQDSFKIIMDQFLKYFIEEDKGPQFGLFGDSWQTIYASQGACGLVESDNLVVIKKEANFRSQQVIVNALNQMRSDLPQFSASGDNDGKITIITTEELNKDRITKGYYNGELDDAHLFTCINNVSGIFDQQWEGTTKKLMITHKMLAKEQGYLEILVLLNDHLKNKDDVHFVFFQNKVEPIYHALVENDSTGLFEVLGVERRPIESSNDKKQWRKLKDTLSIARKGTIGDVLKTVAESRLVGIPPKIIFWMSESEKNDSDNLYYGRPINDLYGISYSEIIRAIDFFKPEALFSTDHGVKGEQYDNVFMVLGRGWNDYRFDKVLYLDPVQLDEERLKTYLRNRNLFYVCCSRSRKNLAILITVPVNIEFRKYLSRVFGEENIVSYTDFMGCA